MLLQHYTTTTLLQNPLLRLPQVSSPSTDRPQTSLTFTMDDSTAAVTQSVGARVFSVASSLLFKVSKVSVGLAVILGAVLYVKQESLLYFPEAGGIPRRPDQNPRGYRSPAERQIPFEEHMIPCADGVSIHSWLLLKTTDGRTVAPNTPTIIFFHGNAGNIGLRLPNTIQMLQYLDANILMVEYRGYGNSDSVTISEAGLRLDAEAALNFAIQHKSIDSNRIFVFGRSLGGAVAMHLADYAAKNNLPLAGCMVENTFLSISHMVDHLLPVLKPIKMFVLKIGWNSLDIVGELQLPILYLAGSADTLVPHWHMLQLAKQSLKSVFVSLHVIENGTHNETWLQGGNAYWDKIRSFMKQAVDKDTVVQRNHVAAAEPTQECNVAESSIPTMPSGLLNMAQEAILGKSSDKAAKKDK